MVYVRSTSNSGPPADVPRMVEDDPNRSYGEAGFAEAVDNLFEILWVLVGQDLAPLID